MKPEFKTISVPLAFLRELGQYIEGTPTGSLPAGVAVSLLMRIEAHAKAALQAEINGKVPAPKPEESVTR